MSNHSKNNNNKTTNDIGTNKTVDDVNAGKSSSSNRKNNEIKYCVSECQISATKLFPSTTTTTTTAHPIMSTSTNEKNRHHEPRQNGNDDDDHHAVTTTNTAAAAPSSCKNYFFTQHYNNYHHNNNNNNNNNNKREGAIDNSHLSNASPLTFVRETMLSPEEYVSSTASDDQHNNHNNNNSFSFQDSMSSVSNHHPNQNHQEQNQFYLGNSPSVSNLFPENQDQSQKQPKQIPSSFKKTFLLPTNQAFFVVESNLEDYFASSENHGDDDDEPPGIILRSLQPSIFFQKDNNTTTNNSEPNDDENGKPASPKSSNTPSSTSQHESHHHRHHHPSEHLLSSASSVGINWSLGLSDVKITSIVGLTLVDLLDCKALVIALKQGFVLVDISRSSTSAKKPRILSRHMKSNIIPLSISAASTSPASRTAQITSVYANGLFLAAGNVNSITGFQSDFYVGYISQQVSFMNNNQIFLHQNGSNGSSSSSLSMNHKQLLEEMLFAPSSSQSQAQQNQHQPQPHPLAKSIFRWIKLNEDQQDLGISPTCISRFYDDRIAIAFEGAPFVYVWINNNGHEDPFAKFSSSAFFGISAAFLTSQQQQRRLHLLQQPGAQESAISANSNFITVSCNFLSVTSLTWMSKSVLVAGTSCGHVSCVDLSPAQQSSSPVASFQFSASASSSSTNFRHSKKQNANRQISSSSPPISSATSFEQLNAVRLPVRSSVPASVEFILSIPSRRLAKKQKPQRRSSTNNFDDEDLNGAGDEDDEDDENVNDKVVVCVTSRCDLFLVDPLSSTVTNATFCASSLLRQFIYCDFSQQSSSLFDIDRPIVFICKETSSSAPLDPGMVAVAFSMLSTPSPSKTKSILEEMFLGTNNINKQNQQSLKLKLVSSFQSSALMNAMKNNSNQQLQLRQSLHQYQNGSFAINTNEEIRQKMLEKWFPYHFASSVAVMTPEGNTDDNNDNNNENDFQQSHQMLFTDKSGQVYLLLPPAVGHGAFGEVWIGVNVKSKKIFAIKRIIGQNNNKNNSNGVGGRGNQKQNNSKSINTAAAASAGGIAALHTLAHEEELINSVSAHPNLLQGILSSLSPSSSPLVSQITTSTHNHMQNHHHLAVGRRQPHQPQHHADLGLVLSFAFGSSLESKLVDYCDYLCRCGEKNERQRHGDDDDDDDDDEKEQDDPSGSNDTGISSLELTSWFTQLLSGLAHLHSCGVVHRDVKPANILDRGHIKSNCHVFCWADFGVSRQIDNNNNNNNQQHSSSTTTSNRHNQTESSSAKEMYLPDSLVFEDEADYSHSENMKGKQQSSSSSLSPTFSLAAALASNTKMGTTVGTPAYNAPEMLASFLARSGPAPSSQSSDVWSLAAVFYCFLTNRPAGTATGFLDIPIVLRGQLPTLMSLVADDENNNTNNNNNHHLVKFPRCFLTLIDSMMKVDRKLRPTATQCLAEMAEVTRWSLLRGESGKNKNNRPDRCAIPQAYVLYCYSPSCLFPTSSIDLTPPNLSSSSSSSSPSRACSKILIKNREYLEFWHLSSLQPSTTTNQRQQLDQNSSSHAFSDIPPKLIQDKLQVQLPHRYQAEAVRAGVMASNASASIYFQKQGNSFDRVDSVTASLLPPRFISDHVCLAPLVSISANYDSESQRNSRLSSTTSETLSIVTTYSVSDPTTSIINNNNHNIISFAQWLDNSRDLRDCIHRLNKIFRSLLKFVAFASSESSLSSLPIVSYEFSDLFVNVATEKLIIGRSVNLLTISLLLDGAEQDQKTDQQQQNIFEKNCHERSHDDESDATSQNLLNAILEDPEIKKHAGLMQRSTLDVIMMIVDNFYSVYKKKFLEIHRDRYYYTSDNYNDDKNNNNSPMSILAKATTFVGTYIQILQKRKQHLMKIFEISKNNNNNESSPNSATTKTLSHQNYFSFHFSQEICEPDFMMAPEFTTFFPPTNGL